MKGQTPVLWALAFLLLEVGSAFSQLAQPCARRGTTIVIDTKSHTMFLCRGGESVEQYPVALGRGGLDKRSEGDNKTPLGEYPLAAPRPSQRFGTFIPVAYPTSKQQKAGLTGGDIGIHGPDRRFTWLGRLTTWVDWTQGCIAVGSDDEIKKVEHWVKENKVVRIFIQ